MKEFKLSLTTLVVLVISTLFSLASCEKGDDFTQRNMLQVHATDGNTDINLSNCQYNLDNLPLEDLSDLEKNSILFMREEEKLARDAYIRFYEQWGLNVFNNIRQSEQTHVDAMLKLINKYDLTDPVGNNDVGVFSNDTLQELYNVLIPQGNLNVVEALKTGALIEEVDIVDLKYALDHFVDNQDIQMVYENLYRASRNHLRAFVKNLSNRGTSYTPQRLTTAEYNEIVNSGWETGN